MNKLIKILLFTFQVVLLISCSSGDELSVDTSSNEESISIYKVTVEEAEETIIDFLSNLEDSENNSRDSNTKRMVSDVQAIRSTSFIARDVDIPCLDTLMYIINFADNTGFAIVGADKRTDPIFAIIDEGNYNVRDFENEENEGFLTFMDFAISKEIKDIITSDNMCQSRTTSKGWNIIYKIDPILKTKWSQGGTYDPNSFGKYCPNKVTGCAVTATAQILSYYQTISNVQWSYNGSTGSSNLNWERIMDDCENTGGYLSSYTTPQSIDEIAHLCFYLGIAFNADYKIDKKNPEKNSTGVGADKPIDWFNKWGGLKASKLTKYDDDKIATAIQFGKPVYARGNSGKKSFLGVRTSWTGGHAWVYDGYIYASKNNEYHKLMHCNWGWGGSCNGFFISNVFNTNVEPEIDDYEISRGDQPGYYRYNLEYSIIAK